MSLRKKATSLLLVIALLLTIVQPCLAELLVTSQNTEDVAFTLNLDAGWNLVSIPLIAENNSAERIFSQINTLDEVPVHIWNGEQFIPTETIEPLNGYFVYTESNLSIELQGSKIEGQTKQLKPGWNMIGGYRVDYPLDLSKIPNQVSQCPSLIFTDGQYVESHELTPGNGAWVFVDEDTLVDDGILRSMPEIEILSPLEDIYSNETIILSGHIKNSDVDTAQIRHNGNSITVPIVSSNFSAELALAEINTISIYIVENGIVYSKEILLDGDHLLDEDERQLGFDPLDPDSDCSVTEENEGGNEIVDGYEIFDGYLPVFAKVKIGADPFNNDTNDNGLTDYFELTKLGVVPGEPSQSVQAALMSTSGDGDDPYLVNSGAWDDPDGDGLSNLDEQNNGTDPLSADTDRDGLSDAEEIQHGTDPCDADADGDLLLDGFEIKIGTNPGVADNGTYHRIEESFADETLDLTLYGPAYSLKTVNVAEVNYSYLIDDTILVSKVYNIDSDEDVQCEELKIKYDSTHVDNSTDLSIYRFDENIGTFLKVESTIDASNEIATCTGANSSKYAVVCSSKWDALFEYPTGEMNFQGQIQSSLDSNADIMFFVRDSAPPGNGLAEALVTINGEGINPQQSTNSSGYTSCFIIPPYSNNRVYTVTKSGYNTRSGTVFLDPEYFGNTTICTLIMTGVNEDVGSILVTSSGKSAQIYVDNMPCCSTNFTVTNLSVGNHNVTLKKTYHFTETKAVTVYKNATTPVHFDLQSSRSTSRIAVISSPPGAAVYVDGHQEGTTSKDLGKIDIDILPGNHFVEVIKTYYNPYNTTLYAEEGQVIPVIANLTLSDSEEDGLPDYDEDNGYHDGFGRWHTTDPNLVDTDGDGLSDGYEVGFQITIDGKTLWNHRSDPTKADTDGDGLDDYWEDYWRTDPFDQDTDHDGIRDGDDEEPLIPLYAIYISDRVHDEIALRLGAVFGETGLKGEVFYELIGGDTYSSTPAYVVGWIASGLALIGDVRDFLYAASQYDTYGAALTGIGLVPLVGDAEKAGADIAKYIGKYPEAIRPLGKYLAEQGIIDWFGEGRLKFIDDFFPIREDGVKVGTHLNAEYGLSADDLVKLMCRGVDLSEVVHVTRVGGDVIPLTRENLEHFIGRHVDGTEDVGQHGTTLFPTSDPVVWETEAEISLQYPGTSTLTREEMKEKLISWIDDALEETQTEWSEQLKNPKYSPQDAKQYGIDEIAVGINQETGVATVYPTKGPQVFRWYNNKWNPTV